MRLRGLPRRVVLEVLFGVHQRVRGGAKILDVTLRAVGDTLRREQAPVIAACPAQLPDPDGKAASLLDSIDLIVPNQANKTMVSQLATQAGLSLDRVYLNIAQVGNASSASIPLAIHDAVRDGVIREPVRIFAPGFGAGAVAGYAVMRVDPAVVVVADLPGRQAPMEDPGTAHPHPEQSSEDVRLAFG